MSEFITNAELRIEAERLCDENEHLREENAKLKRAAERDADVLESLNLSLEESQAENAKMRELLLDCWDFSHLMHGSMAPRYLELGLIGKDEARELGIEMD